MRKLVDQDLTLKAIRFRDKANWDSVRAVNRDWLSPWEATRPNIDHNLPLPSYYGMVMQLNKEMKALRSISLGIWLKENNKQILIGQITLGGIIFGAMRGAHIGYWIDQRYSIVATPLEQLNYSQNLVSKILDCTGLKLICDQKMRHQNRLQ